MTCDREAIPRPRDRAIFHFQLNPPGRGPLAEFRRRSLGRYRNGYRRFGRFLKFVQTLPGD